MTVQAAIDSIGVATGHTACVADDMAKGRLVVPFDIPLPADAGFYFVTPQDRAAAPKLNALRDWLKAAVKHRDEQPAAITKRHSFFA
jgi:LysR family glycine cleavage system transcriptional activator